ncbi:hypothetical protein BVC93_25055 [Mycobacterium sp. MS1601]|uniref:universal stress protein n=1 Tax=Mycobacterium sp. MS1601 TaxID=1936029 RepID=UPI000979764B|nr:universal stress protein [Mycobacterium sp. MS1601]AQA05128.1 hypothetical protein BVC93_25055 [Mycobacterium sp. MS1601]
MKDHSIPSPAVVVGIDGSRSALAAALWAVDEALDRDVPLRLLYAVAPRPVPMNADVAARDLATAEIAIREAFMAVESLDKPVKIEVEIVQDDPIHALLNASRSATMLCVGDLGIGRSTGRHYGSVAAAVSRSTHCPVAVIRRDDADHRGCVIAEVDESTSFAAVLDLAVSEARMRKCPLRVLTGSQPRFTDVADAPDAAEATRDAQTRLDKQLDWWRRRYPDLDAVAVATRGSTLNYLAQQDDSIQLLVVGPGNGHRRPEAAKADAHSALRDGRCSVLISGRHGAL